jgi:hypothetical protein
MFAMQPVRRVSDRKVTAIMLELIERSGVPRANRREYIEAVLWEFAFAVAERAAYPATLEPDPEDSYYSEMDHVLMPWVKEAAKQLDEILDASL